MAGNKASRGWGRWFALAPALLNGNWRSTAAVAAVLVGVAAAANWAWTKWGRPATESPEFRISAEQIETPPQPPWIQTDVKADVIRDSQLTELPLLDPQLTEKVHRAFALHNWVGHVHQVSKVHPRRVVVDLEYRRPIAMVEVEANQGPGLLFVDEYAVLLPSDDFALRNTHNLLRIHVPKTAPAGPYGTPWGDDRVSGAARVAAAVHDVRDELSLRRIVVQEIPGGKTLFELETADGTHVRWGRAPGNEEAGEPTAKEKIARLQAAKKAGTITEVILDIRN